MNPPTKPPTNPSTLTNKNQNEIEFLKKQLQEKIEEINILKKQLQEKNEVEPKMNKQNEIKNIPKDVPPQNSASGLSLNLFPSSGFKTNIDIHKAAAMIMIGNNFDNEILPELPSWTSGEHRIYYKQVETHMNNSVTVLDARDEYGLTYDEIGAILYYTQISKFYITLNTTLSNRNVPKSWLPYMSYLIEGIKKCPKFKGTVYRGEKGKLTESSSQYRKNKCIVWIAFTSTSKHSAIANSFVNTSKYTKMEIESMNGRDISFFSLKNNSEVIFLPNSCFKIVDVKTNEKEDKIILREMIDEDLYYYDEEMKLRIEQLCGSAKFNFEM